MPVNDSLDLEHRDVAPFVANIVLLSVCEIIEPVSLAYSHITGVVPEAGPGFERSLRIAEVAQEETARFFGSNANLASYPVRHRLVLGIQQSDLIMRYRGAQQRAFPILIEVR